jgi:aryl-alcohol dehydrogenase-like predicted oxidoreductase
MSSTAPISPAPISPLFSPRRLLGRTGFVASRLGAGDLADRTLPLETCVATLRRALSAGLNVVDTAPNYEDGYSEQIVGAAVVERRAQIFVIDKIDHPLEPVAPQLDASFSRLKLSYVDAFVFHSVSDLDVWRALVAEGGGMDQLRQEIRLGRVRFRGISSHHPDVVRAAILSKLCDIIMFPVGPWVDARYEPLVALAREHGVGTVCFKTFGAGKLLGDTEGYGRPLAARVAGTSGSREPARLSVNECMRYSLSLDPDVALLGLSSPAEQDEAFSAALAFRETVPAPELAAIRRRAAHAILGKGPCWWNPGGS